MSKNVITLPAPKGHNGAHRWRFFQAAGLRQARLLKGSDFANLRQLPQELWVVLSCPTQGVHFNQRTLELLDSDGDGRIRVPELLAGVEWSCQRLQDPATLMQGAAELPLKLLAANPEGEALRKVAQQVLGEIGKSDRESVTLDDIAAYSLELAKAHFNGDGVITSASGQTPAQQQVVEEIVKTLGGVTDLAGVPGVDKDMVERFYAEAAAYLAWIEKSESEAATILPLGDKTAAAAAAIEAVRVKIDDYFTRCRLAAFDTRAASSLNRGTAEYDALAAAELTVRQEEIGALPLARIEADRPLPLTSGINPYWSAAIETLRQTAVEPLLETAPAALTEADWLQLQAKIAPFNAWQAAKAGADVEPLGRDRLREIVAASEEASLLELIGKDVAWGAEAAALADLDRMIHYFNHLNTLLQNYVNFADFYDSKQQAIFQTGRLYIDGRFCNLCFDVADVGSHATLAEAGKVYLAYCEIKRPSTGETRNIGVAVTAGFASSLWVGRNGIFYDRYNHDWEAKIVKIVESPVSLKEAFWAPWLKISLMISEQVRKLLTAREDAMLNAAASRVDSTTTAVAEGGVVAKPQKMEGAALASSVAAIGIAVGLVGSAIGGLISAISGIKPWIALLGVLVIFLAVSGPSVILAWFKLRARDLAPVLNACGWAVNTRIRVTMRLGRVLTQEAALPPGSELELDDAFAESKRGRFWTLFTVVALLILLLFWRIGWLNQWLSEKWQRPVAEQSAATEAAAEAPLVIAAEEAAAEADTEQ